MARRKKQEALAIEGQAGDAFSRLGDNANGVLVAHVEKIEKLKAQKDALHQQEKEAKADAKADGFALRAINQIIRERAEAEDVRLSHEAETQKYREAMGMKTLFDFGDWREKWAA